MAQKVAFFAPPRRVFDRKTCWLCQDRLRTETQRDKIMREARIWGASWLFHQDEHIKKSNTSKNRPSIYLCRNFIMAGSGTSTYPIDHDDCSSSYHDHHNVLLFGPTKQWCDAFPLPLIGQSRSIFIGNLGPFGICFGGIIMAKNA